MSCFRRLILPVLLLADLLAYGQSFYGRITDEQQRPIPYASIYIEELTMGTSSNEAGDFDVKIRPGIYTVSFQHISYETVVQKITIPRQQACTIVMKEKSYLLPAVHVGKNSGEDPAYAMIRKAIGMAPFYNEPLIFYKANVYIKGAIKVEKISGVVKMMARKELKKSKIREGERYLLESVNEINYNQGRINHKVLSESNTLPPEMKENEISMGFTAGYNIYDADNRLFVSPISPQAFAYYTFQYVGSSQEGEDMINKIKVTPKYQNSTLLSGYIYVADEYWYVYRFELAGKYTGVRFNIKQNYREIDKHVWVPINLEMDTYVDLLGNRGRGDYVHSIKYEDFKVNPLKKGKFTEIANRKAELPENPPAVVQKSAKAARIEEQLAELASKEEISNRDAFKMSRLVQKKEKEEGKALPDSLVRKPSLDLTDGYKMIKDSLFQKQDSIYWNLVRPIPLTSDELKSYQRSDSIRMAGEEHRDSTTDNRNKREIAVDILFGSQFRVDSSMRIQYSGFVDFNDFQSFRFNLVDGLSYRQSLSIDKRFRDTTRLAVTLSGGYAFARKSMLFTGKASYGYWPEKQGVFAVGGGYTSKDFNSRSDVPPLDNMLWTLFARKSYANYFNDAFVYMEHAIEPLNGLMTVVDLSFHRYGRLYNQSDYSFFYRDSREFRPNDPDNIYIVGRPDLLDSKRAVLLQVALSYTPQMHYVRQHRTKQNLGSLYPAMSLVWRKAIPGIWGGKSDFDLLQIGVHQKVDMGLMQSFRYDVIGGWFLRTSEMHFSELKHFDTKPYFASFFRYNTGYRLAPVYSLSEMKWYVTVDAHYETPFLLLKYLPLLNRTIIRENLYLSYISTSQVRHYTEWGYGLSNIFMVGELSVFTGFDHSRYHSAGVKLSLMLSK